MNVPSERAAVPSLAPFLEQRRLNLSYDLAFDATREAFADWAERMRALWRSSLPPCRGPATGSCDTGAVVLGFASGAQAEGRLQLPEGAGPFPAVLLLHDHGGRFDIGWRKMWDDPLSADTRGALYDGVAVAQALVEAGFAVLCMDALGWGERQSGGYAGQQALAANALGLGWSLAGLVAAEDLQAARWLAAHPKIDAARIGTFGFSFGGFRAWQLSALSRDIRAAVSLSWLACRRDMMVAGAPLLAGQSAFYMLHPALAGRLDFPDMAALALRAPLFLRSGQSDRHMPTDSVARAYGALDAMADAGAVARADSGFHTAGHQCPAPVIAQAIAFLDRSLTA
ncbi:Dienelactone hydrolase family protein [Aquimixticola soesokkakensis]|uniref:Dienelactone hydrolase family protein n=1 Tax=Aquimixticola soesokkakensis TaxID=1519096 RepID=A0A1Y5RYP8_9RHOB|nr:alpha/beta hydrolase family protein [Aquimixticola soesokkakensis]SLN27514.1 Dienelactone hydrolase family protein [Aquimixticola soesokkakensis]